MPDLEQQAAELMASGDPREMAERQAETQARAEEDPKHFVDYGEEMVRTANDSTKEMRDEWDTCWNAYQLRRDYSDKEDWQSQIVTPDPFTAIQQAKSVIRRALVDRDEIVNIDPVEDSDKPLAEFWRRTLKFHLNEQHANFPLNASGAAEMAFALGQSMEILPTWAEVSPGVEGLQLLLIPPWHIKRDPDAMPFNPWSGMFWIHQEWVDIWALQLEEQRGYYENVEGLTSENNSEDPETTARRKSQVISRGTFRKSALVSEFWGVVLDRKGNLLYPSSRYTFAGGRLLRKPEPNPFPTLRWPGTSFSAIPHIMRFEGRGILAGALSLWKLGDNLLNLHIDDLNWLVNRMYEIDPGLLKDKGADTEIYPGRVWWKSEGASGRAIQEVTAGRNSPEVLANLQYLTSRWENGTFVNQFVAGLPGSRSNITKGEVDVKTRQSLGVFDSMGRDIEVGLVWAIKAIMETIAINWTEYSKPGVKRVLGPALAEFADQLAMMAPEQRMETLKLNCDLRVSGISALMRQDTMLQHLDALMARAEREPWARYFKPYQMVTAAVDAMNMGSSGVVKTEQELQAEMEAQAAALAAQQAAGAGGGLADEVLAKHAPVAAAGAGAPNVPRGIMPVGA